MLPKNAYIASIGLAQQFAERGQIVRPVTNTLLDELVRYTTRDNDIIPVDPTVTNYESVGSWIETVTRGSLENPSPHSLSVDSIVTTLAKAIRGHLAIAQSVVKPVIQQFAERLETALSETPLRDPSTQFDLQIADLPEFAKDASFLATIERYEGKNRPILPSTSMHLPMPEMSTFIQDYLAVGESTVDQWIHQWATTLGMEFFQDVLTAFFKCHLDGSVVEMKYAPEDVFGLRSHKQLNVALALSLISQKLYHTDQVPATSINLAGYRENIQEIREFAGVLIHSILKKWDLNEKHQLMVLDMDLTHYKCTVLGPVYRQWLSQGGSPEIIYGMLLSGESQKTPTGLTENQDRYLEQWKSYVVYHHASSRNQQLSQFKELVELIFVELLSDKSEEELAYLTEHPQFSYQKALAEEVQSIKLPDLANIHSVAMRVICRARFPYTSAEVLLSGIEEAMQMDPALTVREAALISTIHYIVDFLADQMDVRPC